METKHTQGLLVIDKKAAGHVRTQEGRGIANTMGYTTNMDNGEHIEENKANAERIALCWNTHDSLVSALKDWVDYCEKQAIWDKVGQKYYTAKQLLNSLNIKP